jgi:hypothetical protein
MRRKIVVELLAALAVLLALIAPRLGWAQEPVVPGSFAPPAGSGNQQQWSQFSSSNPLPASTDPCSSQTKLNAAVGTSGASNVQAVAGSGTKKVYICSISLIAGAAATFNVIEGTGSACVTSAEAAIIGSTTAANGLALAANGGLTLGNGTGTVGVTATGGNGVCVLASSSVQFGGNMTYVQQ